jgi:hypothetical protein
MTSQKLMTVTVDRARHYRMPISYLLPHLAMKVDSIKLVQHESVVSVVREKCHQVLAFDRYIATHDSTVTR